MGYEIKLYLGTHHDINFDDQNDSEGHYFSQVAWIDLCKPGGDSAISNINSDSYQAVYFYGVDGNTRIACDPYGEYLRAIPATIVLKALRKDWKNSKKECSDKTVGYRRFYMAVALLERFILTFPNENPCVVIYGY